jgi:hypothetical protein
VFSQTDQTFSIEKTNLSGMISKETIARDVGSPIENNRYPRAVGSNWNNLPSIPSTPFITATVIDL